MYLLLSWSCQGEQVSYKYILWAVQKTGSKSLQKQLVLYPIQDYFFSIFVETVFAHTESSSRLAIIPLVEAFGLYPVQSCRY